MRYGCGDWRLIFLFILHMWGAFKGYEVSEVIHLHSIAHSNDNTGTLKSIVVYLPLISLCAALCGKFIC